MTTASSVVWYARKTTIFHMLAHYQQHLWHQNPLKRPYLCYNFSELIEMFAWLVIQTLSWQGEKMTSACRAHNWVQLNGDYQEWVPVWGHGWVSTMLITVSVFCLVPALTDHNSTDYNIACKWLCTLDTGTFIVLANTCTYVTSPTYSQCTAPFLIGMNKNLAWQ